MSVLATQEDREIRIQGDGLSSSSTAPSKAQFPWALNCACGRPRARRPTDRVRPRGAGPQYRSVRLRMPVLSG